MPAINVLCIFVSSIRDLKLCLVVIIIINESVRTYVKTTCGQLSALVSVSILAFPHSNSDTKLNRSNFKQ